MRVGNAGRRDYPTFWYFSRTGSNAFQHGEVRP